MPVIWSIWLKFDGVKSVQVISPPITNQTAKNSIQLSRSPFLARVGLHTQPVSQGLIGLKSQSHFPWPVLQWRHPSKPVDQGHQCLHRRLGPGKRCLEGWRRVWHDADREILCKRAISVACHIYTWYKPGIYQGYTLHMTICRIWLDYTMKNIYGFVPYQSRTLIAKGYTWYIRQMVIWRV